MWQIQEFSDHQKSTAFRCPVLFGQEQHLVERNYVHLFKKESDSYRGRSIDIVIA